MSRNTTSRTLASIAIEVSIFLNFLFSQSISHAFGYQCPDRSISHWGDGGGSSGGGSGSGSGSGSSSWRHFLQNHSELALLCGTMFSEESDKVKKYVGGLLDMIQGSVMASKPKAMQEAIEIANDLMDQKIRAYFERQAENKRKFNNNNQAQQQLPKRYNVVQDYAVETCKRKEYARTLPLCNKYKFHHNGPCTAKCANCKKVRHLTMDCWNPTATSNQRTIICYECGNQGHYKSDCPELKNRNHENQAEGTEARGMVYAL
nr:hypothetical protein [Tanacetum cinerariifolium]